MQKPCKLALELAIVAFMLIFTSPSASAYWPCSGRCACYGWNGYYSIYSQESVPYYALNPPVYYSYPVARTYGLYPFPYVSETVHESSVSVEPKLVINSFIEGQSAPKSASLGHQPLRISNPFVDRAGESNTVERADSENQNPVKPKVVYPSKLVSK